jgi:glyoxylase-like metal-dependent hydrolase (beta-lactamase superfamily II)
MLPMDGSVPALPGWRWIATPGHTPGHVSFFRESDRTLIAGDAVVTTRQESLIDVLTQRETIWRPPAYYTQNWGTAGRSVADLARLDPEVLATGHGHPLRGPSMRRGLHDLAARFDELIPRDGRYVREPALADERGTVYVPPSPGLSAQAMALGVTAITAGAIALALRRR